MIGIFGNVDGMSRSLSFHLLRQNLISANVANVDTPGYAPKELERPDSSMDPGFGLSMRVTDSRHIDHGMPTDGPDGSEYNVIEEREEVPGNDNNYVSLDYEMSRLTANTIRYETVGRLLTKHLAILGYAAADAGR